MKILTSEEAVKFGENKLWESMTFEERAMFQMQQDYLCMPFSKFHESMEKALGRPIWTHEFGLNRKGLEAELFADAPPPTFDEIVGMLPANKTIMVTV